MGTPAQDRKRRWRRRHLIQLAVAFVAVVVVGVALADQITPDGDIVTAGDQSTVNLGTVAPGAELTPKTSFKLECNGNKHADNGQTVNLTFSLADSTVASGGSLSATNTSIGPIPSSWADDGNNCPSGPALAPIGDNGDSTVTITAPMTAGPKTFVVAWAKSVAPPDVTGGNVTVTYNLTVAAPSDTTPPVISYVLTPGSPDGNNDWYKSNVTLVWTVTEAESPGSLVKTGCDNQNITADQAATTYSCSATSTGGSAGPVSATIKRDATAPSAETTLNTAANGSNGWYTTAPAWTTNGADALSGLVSDPCETGTYSGGEGTGLTVSGTCTDQAGNETSDASPSFKYDATGPSANLAVTAGTEGSNGWYTSDVTVSTSGTDLISNPTTCTANQLQTAETAGQVFNGSCTNDAGLTTNAAPLTVKLDKTAPSVVYTSQSPVANAAGWNKTDVVATFTATDTLSGFAGPSTTQTGTSTSSGEGAAVSVDSPAFVDLAGNEAAAGAASHSFKIDATAPSAETTLNTAANGSNGWYTTAPAWTTNGADALSGLVSDPCETGTYSGGEGTGLTVSGTCTDQAGNETSDASPSFKYDATGPSANLAVTAGTEGSNGWYTSDVTVSTSGTDLISNPTTCTANQLQTAETAGQVFNGSCTNDAGLTTNAAPLTVKLDKTGPTAALAVTVGTAGSNGWYTSDVTVSTSGTDLISNPTTCTANQLQTAETAGQVFNGSCTNDAGLTTNAAPLTVKLDKTGPTAALAVTVGTAGSNGWYTSDVTVSTSGTDLDQQPDDVHRQPAPDGRDGGAAVQRFLHQRRWSDDQRGSAHGEARQDRPDRGARCHGRNSRRRRLVPLRRHRQHERNGQHQQPDDVHR